MILATLGSLNFLARPKAATKLSEIGGGRALSAFSFQRSASEQTP